MVTETLEPRILLSADFGDAVDLSAGNGPRDYTTLAEHGGPSHLIPETGATVYFGASVDVEAGSLQNRESNADDVDSALPDDEDGVLDPRYLQATVGAVHSITVLVTNTSGADATAFGWIDFNQDGVFDNTSDRASVLVPPGTVDGRVSLTFPKIPMDAAGETYLRLRVSSDSATADSIGPASDGEIGDDSFTTISTQPGGFHFQWGPTTDIGSGGELLIKSRGAESGWESHDWLHPM